MATAVWVPSHRAPELTKPLSSTVLMEFPDESAFREWAESPDYQRISEDRRAGADTVVLLVQALPRKAS
jgi:uncharacterized protein (DUF1330 family)